MKRDLLLLYQPASSEEGHRSRIPYGLLYLERAIRGLGLEVVLVDGQLRPDVMALLRDGADRLLLAGVSAMTGFQITGGIAFSLAIKSVSDAPVIWGGWHPSILPEQTLREPFVDFVVTGQGERPLRELILRLQNNSRDFRIAGLGSKTQGRITLQPPAAFEDLNHLPDLNLDLIDPNAYVFNTAYAKRCLGYFSSHGCPFHCGFCCVADIYGQRWYPRPPDAILRDLGILKERAGIDSVTFDDDNFFVNKSFTRAFLEQLRSSGLNLLWDTSAHAGTFRRQYADEDVERLYRSGCRQIYIGAESGDPDVLSAIEKHASVEDADAFVRLLKRHGIIPFLSTMVGFPEAPKQDLRLTLEMIRKAVVHDSRLRARIFFYTPYPGTRLYANALAHGFHPPETLAAWAHHTLRRFRAPWIRREHRWALEIFANFYMPLGHPGYFRMVPRAWRPAALLLNIFFYPVARLRFHLGWFRFPVEARMFLFFLRLLNRLFRTRLSLGFESYLD
ncbi:MAG: radical SAM protein [Fibrobacterota bacterium]